VSLTGSSSGSAPVIELAAASFGYADRTVVSRVSLRVMAGEVLALLGPNGSGKSTLIKGLLRLTQLQGGRVLLFGEPLAGLRDRHRVGYVPQHSTSFDGGRATAAEVVAVGRLPHLPWHGRMRPVDRRRVAQALDFVGLTQQAHHPVRTLSGGQQRRVLIARALAGEPDLMIMDEPTAGVDETNQRLLAAVVSRLAAEGKALVIVTHDLAAFAEVATRAVVLASGRITYDGPADALPAERPLEQGHHHPDLEARPLDATAGPLDHAMRGRHA
jgi:zinc transport system ATP-binding protein